MKHLAAYMLGIAIMLPLQVTNYLTWGSWWDRNELWFATFMPIAIFLLFYSFAELPIRGIQRTLIYYTGACVPILWWSDIALPSGYGVYENLEAPIGDVGFIVFLLNVFLLFRVMRHKDGLR